MSSISIQMPQRNILLTAEDGIVFNVTVLDDGKVSVKAVFEVVDETADITAVEPIAKHRGRKTKTRECHSELMKAWADGKSGHELAQVAGLTQSGVYAYMHRHSEDFPKRPNPRIGVSPAPRNKYLTGEHLRKEEKVALVTMYEEGKTPKELAEYFGVSLNTIYYHTKHCHRHSTDKRRKNND